MPVEEQLFSRFENLLWHFSRNMSYVWNEAFKQRFPGSESYILFVLEQDCLKRMSELAESLCLTPGAVTVASDKLIRQGYIERIQNEEDRRIVNLKITDRGEKILIETRNEGRKAMRSVFNDLSEQDLERMVEIFEKAIENLNNNRKGNV